MSVGEGQLHLWRGCGRDAVDPGMDDPQLAMHQRSAAGECVTATIWRTFGCGRPAILDGGDLALVDAALAGRRPLVPPGALDDFLRGGGSIEDFQIFLTDEAEQSCQTQVQTQRVVVE